MQKGSGKGDQEYKSVFKRLPEQMHDRSWMQDVFIQRNSKPEQEEYMQAMQKYSHQKREVFPYIREFVLEGKERG